MAFRTPLRIEEIGRCWRLLEPLIWDDGVLCTVVPAGFTTDLDSVPRLPVVYVLFKGRARAAAVLHDWLYHNRAVPRAEADRVFRDAMAAQGVPLWQRWPIWLGVRTFGGVAMAAARSGR